MLTTVTVARAEPGLLPHFPDLVRLPDGTLLAAYREGAGHVRSDGRIRVVTSADGGQTWGRPHTAVDGPWDDRDPKLAVLADGSVLLSWFVLDWSTEPHTNLGTFVRRSPDGGLTWGDSVQAGVTASHGAAVQLPGGDLLLPLYGRQPGGQWEQATVARSTDLGATWTVSVLAARDGVNFQEPTLTVLDSGELVALIRTTGDVAWIARSADDGHTWSVAEPTDLPASSHHALVLSSGEVLVTYGDLARRFSPRRDTVGRVVRRPEGSWNGYPDVQLYDSGHHDQANPSSAEVAPGRYLTLGFDIPAAAVVGVFSSAEDFPA
ncbi:sialidase family protein [Symbioplanes lichenis]|uniref:sialidase family protein n=1 Tax=Symbioplanes lichenis TaxID=1629072 RepID=UPI00273899FB|nr:sialidase family protein [Actinoplanes lichenis]